jgi:hypothetical protein
MDEPDTATEPATPEPATDGTPEPNRKGGGKKGRSGPPRGNANAQRHGMSGGKLPPDCVYIEHRVNALRRRLEEAVTALKGEVNFVDAAAINSVLKWERHGMLAQHWLRHEAENLSVAERLRFSEAIAKASDNRDKNIRALGLDREQPMPWNIVDVTPTPIPPVALAVALAGKGVQP